MNARFGRPPVGGAQLVFPPVHEHVGFQFGPDHSLFEGVGHGITSLLVKPFFLNHKKTLRNFSFMYFFKERVNTTGFLSSW